jgi:hypothetical protein
MINRSPIRTVKSFSLSRTLSTFTVSEWIELNKDTWWSFSLWTGETTRQLTPNSAEFSRDMPSRLMFAHISVESSSWPLFDGWPGETRKVSNRTFRYNYEFTERRTISFGSGSRSTTFVDTPDNQTGSGEWSRNAAAHETMDTAWFEWS